LSLPGASRAFAAVSGNACPTLDLAFGQPDVPSLPHLCFLQDETQALGPDDVLAGRLPMDRRDASELVFRHNQSAYWVYVPLRNLERAQRVWYLQLDYPLLDEVDAWVYDLDTGPGAAPVLLDMERMGESRPFDARPVRHRLFLLPLEFGPLQPRGQRAPVPALGRLGQRLGPGSGREPGHVPGRARPAGPVQRRTLPAAADPPAPLQRGLHRLRRPVPGVHVRPVLPVSLARLALAGQPLGAPDRNPGHSQPALVHAAFPRHRSRPVATPVTLDPPAGPGRRGAVRGQPVRALCAHHQDRHGLCAGLHGGDVRPGPAPPAPGRARRPLVRAVLAGVLRRLPGLRTGGLWLYSRVHGAGALDADRPGQPDVPADLRRSHAAARPDGPGAGHRGHGAQFPAARGPG